MRLRYRSLAFFALFLPFVIAQTTKPAAKQPDLSGEAIVVEQMHTVVRVTRDGSSTRTFQLKARVLSDAGLRDAGTVTTAYASSHETSTIDYVRVRKPDGTVVDTPTGDAQEVPLPVTQAAPMYSDLRSKQLPVKSLSVGDTLEYQLTVVEKNVDAPGNYWCAVDFNEALPVKEEVIEFHIPREMTLTVKSKSVQPVIREEGSERIYRWTHETVSKYPKKNEKEAAPVPLVPPLYEPDIAVTTFRSWAELGAWYQGVIKDRAVPDAAIQAKADELTKGLSTDDEKIEALYHYVATQYRYISVSLGIGRVQPHTAAEVFRNQYGDCKDKHTLLQAMLAAEKIEAEPVLIHSSVRLNEALPLPAQFDHMITLVKPGPQQIWLDTTPEVAPSRLLLAILRGKQALALPLRGDAHLVTTPAALPFPAYYRQTITGTLDAQGTLTAHFDQSVRGDLEVVLRTVFHQVPRAKWQELEQGISNNTGFAGEVSSVEAAPPEKTQEAFHASWAYTRKDFGDWPNRKIPGMTPWLGSDLPKDTKEPERPIRLVANEPVEFKEVLTLPEGYTMTPPDDVKRSTAFADYTSTYTVKGQTLELNRRLIYKVEELPVSEWGAYREFEKAVNDDAGQMMQLFTAQSKPELKPQTTQPPKVLSKEDQATAALIVMAEEESRANNTVHARKLLEQASSRNEHMRGLWMAWGDINRRSHKTAQAIADYRKQITQHPDFFWAYPELIALYSETGDWKSAEDVSHTWRAANPSEPKVLERLASILMFEEHYREAAAAYQEAIAASPESDELKIQLGRALLRGGDTAAGKKTLHTLIKQGSDAVTVNAAIYELADAGIDLDGDEAASLNQVEMLETRNRNADMSTAGDQDLVNGSLLATAWDTLGWIYYKEKRLPEAEAYVRSAWLWNQRPEVGVHLGRICEAEGKQADELTAYRLAVRAWQTSYLSPELERMKEQSEKRVAALKAKGVREKPAFATQSGGDELGAMRTYTVPNPLKGEYGYADFMLQMGNNRAEDVRFLSGSDSLRTAGAALRSVQYRTPLPPDSHAKILRRGILACSMGSNTCMLALLPPPEVRRLAN